MGLISTSIPNLINGVSQQPASLRMPTQCEAMVNCYPSVVEGLIKRPPIEHVAQLISGAAGAAHVHFYQRDADERYAVVLRDNSIKVFDLDGNEKTVTTPDGVGYLDVTDANADFATITIADYTFIVNKRTTVAMNAAVSGTNEYLGMIFVKQGTYGGDYAITINGTEQASFVTSTTDVTQVATDYIANQLATQLTTNLGATWTVTRKNHVIMVKKNDGSSFTMSSEDPLGGDGLRTNVGSVQTFADLPTVCVHDHVIKVAGDNNSEFDDYYVKFVANDGTFSEGYWTETLAPNTQYQINPATMPHVLIDNGDGTFTFEQATWGDRVAGDTDSAPNPSFIGKTITDIVFFRNRLGLLADQNIVLSQAGSFFNFWPETVTTVLDDAPIDIEATHTKVSLLRHAVPFNKQLLLFSDQTQFVLDSDELLTPKTAAITTATEFENSPSVRPVSVGQNVYFVTPRGAYAGVREYFVESDSETNDAADITAHIPQYIDSGITELAVSSAEDILCAVSGDTNYDHLIYTYKFYWQGNEKLQSAWGQWDLSQDSGDVIVRGLHFFNSTMYLCVQRGSDGLYLERIRLEAARLDPYQSYITHLDRRITDADCSSVTYSAVTDKTTWTLPYPVRSNSMAIVTRGNADGDIHGRSVALNDYSVGDTTLVADGDWSARDVWIGNRYTALYQPSEPVLKEASSGGGQVAIQAGRLQVRFYLLSFADTGYFNVAVTPKYRDTFNSAFTGRILGSGNNILGVPAIETGSFRVPITANSKEVDVVITSDSHLPMKLQSAEWEIFYTIRSARR